MIAIPAVKNASIKQIKTLAQTIKYRNEQVIDRFTDQFDIDRMEAEGIFVDCLRWLWLCANAAMDRKRGNEDVPEKIAIDHSILIIDEMWHNFLCFTKDYQEFCLTYFGFFIHHNPTPKAFNAQLKHLFDTDPATLRKRREIQYTYTGLKLGEEVFRKWYIEYPEKYSSEQIKKLRK